MKILVTGYKGFIGTNVAQYLQSQGHEVEGWDYIPNAIPDPEGFDWVPPAPPRNVSHPETGA